MIDMHSHCLFSPDSSTNPEDNILYAIEKDIKFLAFTDHVDRFLDNEIEDYCFDLEEYFSTLEALRYKYRDQIQVLIGVEIGLGVDIAPWMDAFMNQYPFDFIIGSIHAVYEGNQSWDRVKLNQEPDKWYEIYYQTMLECVQATKNFHVLGHLDYIDRYVVDKTKIPPFERHAPIVEEILKELISTGRGIEYNTAGFRKNLPYGNPKDPVLEKYHKLGGRILTLSSDAHRKDHIGWGISEAMDHVHSLGFKKLFYYKDKKPLSIPLSSKKS